MKKRTLLLNMEYSALSGFYWMLFSVTVSFAVLYLGSRGFSSTQAGFVLAAGNTIALFLQPTLGAVADSSKKLSLISILAAVCAAAVVLFFIVGLMPDGSALLTVFYTILLAAVFSMQPLCNSFSFFLEGWGVHINFGVARGIGSLSYAVIAAVLGAVAERMGAVPVPGAGIAITGLMLVSLAVFKLQKRRFGVKAAPEVNASASGAQGSSLFAFIRKYRRFCVFLVSVAIMQFSHTMIVNFMIETVEHVGGGSGDLGLITAVTAVVELPAMFLFDRLCKKTSARSMLRFSAVMFTVKAALIFFAGSISAVYFACLFQSLSFAVFTPASVRYAREEMDESDAVKGQAGVTGLATLGAVFSSFFGGMLFDGLGVSPTLLICTAVSAVGTVMSFIVIPGRKKQNKPDDDKA